MAHIPLAGAHAEPRGPAGSEEVDVLRPEAGALCRHQASAVRALDWDEAGPESGRRGPSQLLELQGEGAQPRISDEETEAQTGPDLSKIAGAS